ncbi:hypothetical protein WJX77_006108 [Trebouxia sp. C0004]
MAKSKLYAVKKGLVPGIYHTWADCQKQTHQVSVRNQSSQVPAENTEQHSSTAEEASLRPGDKGVASRRPAKVAVTAQAKGSVFPAWLRPEATYRLEFDGAARGNPGPAGAGAALFDDFRDMQVGSICLKLGMTTNNQAEYSGLLAGMEAAKVVGVKKLRVLGDSQLIVRQVTGRYKVSNEGLRALYTRVKKVQKTFENFQIEHMLRDKNKVADALSNQAIDTSGWQGLKDMQGQLWGMCDVWQASQATNQPEAVVDARPLKRACAYHDSACSSASGFNNDIRLSRHAWKLRLPAPYSTCCSDIKQSPFMLTTGFGLNIPRHQHHARFHMQRSVAHTMHRKVTSHFSS